jgi:hypothetical protein
LVDSTFDSLTKNLWSCFTAESVDDNDTKQWIENDTGWSGLEYHTSMSEDEETLNGFEEKEVILHLSRDHSSEKRTSNIPVLRELPSFGSTLTSFTGSSGSSPSRQMAIRAMNGVEEELISYEKKLPNINTMTPPRNPALRQNC